MIKPFQKIYTSNLKTEEKEWSHICKNQIRCLQHFQPPGMSEKTAAPPLLIYITPVQSYHEAMSCKEDADAFHLHQRESRKQNTLS